MTESPDYNSNDGRDVGSPYNQTYMRPCLCEAVAFLLTLLVVPWTQAQSQSKTVEVVPDRVAVLVRPVLVELQEYRSDGARDHRKIDELFYALAKRKGPSVDEALVVLMCFDVMGESQEDTDAVIARGRKMLRYIEKYHRSNPKISGYTYTESLLKNSRHKDDDFLGATKAIRHGWRGTWDNPEG